MRKLLILLILCCWPASAQTPGFDGLTLLGTGGTLTDKESRSEMTLRGFHSKYKDPIVGLFITQHGKEVRYYMDGATWDRLKQKLIQARDQWKTLSPTEFKAFGAVRGYRIANRRATLSMSMQGSTKLDNKRLDFSVKGDTDRPQRAFISLTYEQVKVLVEQLYKVDEFLRSAG